LTRLVILCALFGLASRSHWHGKDGDYCRRDVQGIERWWLEVGERNKTQLVPATDELIAKLARYRRAHGLAPTPQPGRQAPAASENRDKGLSRGALHLMLKEVFVLAAARTRARMPPREIGHRIVGARFIS